MASQDRKPDYRFIDCARGYAILLVIMTHVSGAYAGLPYPVSRMAHMGWHGVQMFFVASAMTLMMSWTFRARRERPPLDDFFIRRFFRIAPMYYAAIPLYLFAWTPAHEHAPGQLLATMTFMNSWHPATMPTVPGAWMVVPGGWSIGDEFSFYLVFPFLASTITTLRRALVAFVAALIIAFAANRLALAGYAEVGPVALNNFLYYWLPNQLPVFAIGFAAFHLWHEIDAGRRPRLQRLLSRWSAPITAACLALVLSLTYFPLGKWVGDGPRVPMLIAAALAFAVGIVAMSQSATTPFVNRLVAKVGQWSFSAYVLHFAAFHLLFTLTPGVAGVERTGMAAVGAFAAAYVFVTAVTMALSSVTYEVIEKPFMKLGGRISARRRATPART